MYTILREFADSWFLLAMFAFFLSCIFWAFRPGSRKIHRDTADIPFRHEDKPASSGISDQAQSEEARP